MPDQMNKASQERRHLSEGQCRIEMADFLKLARTYLTNITIARESLQHVYTLFNRQRTISVAQCNEAITLIRAMDAAAQLFAQFLDQKACLPSVILPLRYQPVTELACIKDQLWTLKALIGMFRSICHNRSCEVVRQRYEILYKLDTLLQGSEEVVRLSQIMFDQACFQKHKNAMSLSALPLKDNITRVSIHEFSSYRKKR